MRKFPKLGIYVVMFTDIFKTFAQFFVVCFLFIVAFGLGFHILLYDQVRLWCMSQLPTYITTRFLKVGNGNPQLSSSAILVPPFLDSPFMRQQFTFEIHRSSYNLSPAISKAFRLTYQVHQDTSVPEEK